MEKAILLCFAVVVAGGVFFWLYRAAMQRMEERVLERLEEAQRTQQRQQRAALGLALPPNPSMPPTNHSTPALPELEGVPVEIFEKECADVLSQIAARRKQFRRSPTRRRGPNVG